MERYRFIVMRVCGGVLLLMLFGLEVGASIAHYGDRFHDAPLGFYVFLALMGLLAMASVWSASRFRYADQLVIGMIVMLLVGLTMRATVERVSWLTIVPFALVVLGGLVLAFGRGKRDDTLPLARWRRFSERKGLPRLNRRRERQGLEPVASFQELRDKTPTAERRRQIWLSVFSAPLVFVMVPALIHDIGHQGGHTDERHYSVVGVTLIAIVLSGLCVGAWAFSLNRHRMIVLVVELLLVVGSFVAFLHDRESDVTPLSVAADVLWLVLIYCQMAGQGRQRRARDR